MIQLMQYTRDEKMEKCRSFMEELCAKLNGYEYDESPYSKYSSYCIPVGTNEQNSYYSKPENSFRCSSHWNWYANTNKCSIPTYIQCNNVDLPRVRNRPMEGKPSTPIAAWQVAFFGKDKRFHCVYGEKFDRKTGKWEWIENSVDQVLQDLAEVL